MILSATIFTSCNQIIEPSKNFYHYSVSISITTGSSTSSGQIGSVVSDIDIQLGPKLNKLFELTEEEAYLEWDSFISSLQRKPNIKFVGNDYYKVSFVECEVGNKCRLIGVRTNQSALFCCVLTPMLIFHRL